MDSLNRRRVMNEEKKTIERIEAALLAARRPRPAHEPDGRWQAAVMQDIRRIAATENTWAVLLAVPMRWVVPVCAAVLVLLLGLNLHWNRTSELGKIEMVLSDPAAPPASRELWIRSIL
jgi:hypothetical protein